MNIQKHIKQKQAQKSKNKDLEKAFKWRDRRGNYHDPANMETNHLFYTIRMIWNHKMPKKLEPYNKYKFGVNYSDEYIEKSLRVMVPELASRKNIADSHRADLKVMTRWLSAIKIKDREKSNKENKNDAVIMILK